jgi:hypothetical protein
MKMLYIFPEAALWYEDSILFQWLSYYLLSSSPGKSTYIAYDTIDVGPINLLNQINNTGSCKPRVDLCEYKCTCFSLRKKVQEGLWIIIRY